jgi:hypothetical protein
MVGWHESRASLAIVPNVGTKWRDQMLLPMTCLAMARNFLLWKDSLTENETMYCIIGSILSSPARLNLPLSVRQSVGYTGFKKKSTMQFRAYLSWPWFIREGAMMIPLFSLA